MDATFREVCLRCRRPREVCYCDRIVRADTRSRVVLLQHPREARVPIGTARMAHLALPNSELHTGVQFSGHPRVEALAREPGTFLLFPGEGARAPDSMDVSEIRHLVVVDGTWPQARKVLKENPLLQQLPRLGLVPRKPGNYRIRKEPAADCLATIEAVVEVLGVLERDPQRFDAMLAAFEWMVDQQLARAATRVGPPRHKKPRQKPELPEARFVSRLADVVALHVEVNAHAKDVDVAGPPEMLHLVAERVVSGERFEAVLAPRRPLAKSAPFHLGIGEERILGGESVDAVRGKWRAFVREDDVFATWGGYPLAQLAKEGFESREHYDLRTLVARRFQSRPGSPADAAKALGAALEAVEGGRAHRTVRQMVTVAKALAQTTKKSAAA